MKENENEREPQSSLSISKLKDQVMSLFREERVVPERPREILLYCEWQMPVARKYSDYEAAVLTPKMQGIWKEKIRL